MNLAIKSPCQAMGLRFSVALSKDIMAEIAFPDLEDLLRIYSERRKSIIAMTGEKHPHSGDGGKAFPRPATVWTVLKAGARVFQAA